MKTIRALVTGAGSGVGQGIMKSLRLSSLPIEIIAADISVCNQGLFRADQAVILPPVETEGSLATIITRLQALAPDVILIGSEFDLLFFAQHKEFIEKETGALVVASPVATIEIANDKWRTVEFLRQHNLSHAPACCPVTVDAAVQTAEEWGYPLILKPRAGTSSRHVHVVQDQEELRRSFSSVPGPMLQKMITRPSAELGREYTCSIFKTREGTILGPFTARRTLRGGSSWLVEVDRFADLHPLLSSIGSLLPAMGTLNVQLMTGPDGPVPFEFNARFSGTTAVRAYFGFNEPEMAIRHYLLGDSLAQPVIGKGMAMRYLEEVFVDGVTAAELQAESLPKGKVLPWF